MRIAIIIRYVEDKNKFDFIFPEYINRNHILDNPNLKLQLGDFVILPSCQKYRTHVGKIVDFYEAESPRNYKRNFRKANDIDILKYTDDIRKIEAYITLEKQRELEYIEEEKARIAELEEIRKNLRLDYLELEEIEILIEYGAINSKKQNYIIIDGIFYTKNLKRIVLCPRNFKGKVVIPKTVKKIPEEVFLESGVVEVVLHDEIEEIVNEAFLGSDLSNINLPASLKKLGHNAFACTKIIELVLPENLEKFGNGLLSGNTAITKIILPMNMKSLPMSFLDGCESLAEIKIHEGIEIIKNHAFSECINLEKIILPLSLKCVEEDVFMGCNNLTICFRGIEKCVKLKDNWNPDNRPIVWNYGGD